jgi:hypothetical protein
MCGKSKKLLACLPVKVEVNGVKACAQRGQKKKKRKNVCAERLATLTTLASLFGCWL